MSQDAWRRPDGHQSVGDLPERQPSAAPLMAVKVGLRQVAPGIDAQVGLVGSTAATPSTRPEQDESRPLQGPEYGIRAASRVTVRSFMVGLGLFGKRERPEPLDEGGPISMRRLLEEERIAKKEAARKRQATDARLLRSRMGALALVLFASTVLSLVASEFSPAQAYTIPTGSMEPVLPKGSLLTVGPGDVEVGTIIVFTDPGGQEVAHRVVALVETAEGPRIRTQGDANEATDSFLIKHEDVVGVYWKHVPYAGYLWLMPLWLQATMFFGFTLCYTAIALRDAGSHLRLDKEKMAALTLVFIVMVPGAFGGVVVTAPGSQTLLDVLSEEMNALQLSEGDMGETTIADNGNSAETILGEQKLWKEAQLLHCDPGHQTGFDHCGYSFDSTSFTVQGGSRFRVPSLLPAPVFFFEVTMDKGSADSVEAMIRDMSVGTGITESMVSVSSTGETTVRSGAFNLEAENDIAITIKRTGGSGATGLITSAKLVMYQPYDPNEARPHTVTAIRIGMGGHTTSSSITEPDMSSYWTYNASRYNGDISGSLMLTASSVNTGVGGSLDGRVYLYEDGVQLTSKQVTSGTPQIFTAGFTPQDGSEYSIRYRAPTDGVGGTQSTTLYNAFIMLHQEAIDETGITNTEHVLDMTNPFTFEGTSYSGHGFVGRYHEDSEWGNATGELQVTMLGEATGHIRLVADPAGAATAKGSLSAQGSKQLVASGPITLRDGNVTYGIEAKTDIEGAAIVYGARFVVPQEFGKTYYNVVETTPTACTWEYIMQYRDSADLLYVDHLEIRMNTTSGTATQIIASAGEVTRESGDTLEVVDEALQITAYYRHGDMAGSMLEVELYARCGGIHVRQPVTFQFIEPVTGT